MYVTFKTVGAVFARGASKGVPRKALRNVGGRSLLERAIDHALSCSQIEAVFVSTDDEEYASRAEQAGAQVPFLRPAHLATDTAAEIEAWRHLLRHLVGIGIEPETLVSVPPTAPLRLDEDIGAALDRYEQTGADIVVSAHRSNHSPAFNMMLVGDDGWARLASDPGQIVVRRQDAPPIWNLTTVAYVSRVEYVMSAPHIFSGRVALSPVPPERSLDIDCEFDLHVADLVLRERER